MIGLIIGIAVAHELCHVLGAKALHFEPVLEFVPPRVYTPNKWGTRRDGILLLATPLIFLNVIGVVLWLGTTNQAIILAGTVILVVNTAIAVADLYMIAYLVWLPAGSVTIVVETDDGLQEFVAEPSD